MLTALVPTLTVNLCYLISNAQGHVVECVPYIEGCTSISSTGRHGFSYFLFKAGMLCSAALLTLYWRRMSELISASSGQPASIAVTVGTGGAAFLLLYTAFLGSEGDIYFLLRRFGTILYFGLTLIAQLMVLRRLEVFAPPWTTRLKKAGCLAMLGFGTASIPVMNYMDDKDAFQNIIEWNLSLLMQAYFLVTAIWLTRVRKASSGAG
ncbi:hypothetical protein [Candidatus Foliamicus sp.]